MHLIKLLNSWREISSIISITIINNRQEYKKTIDRFKVLLNDFKESSQEKILNSTTDNEEDQKETLIWVSEYIQCKALKDVTRNRKI